MKVTGQEFLYVFLNVPLSSSIGSMVLTKTMPCVESEIDFWLIVPLKQIFSFIIETGCSDY